MTDFKVDFTNVESKSFDPVPSGKYLLAVTGFDEGETSDTAKNPNQPLINFEFTIQEPETIGKTKVAERKLWTNILPTVESVLWRLKNFMEALDGRTYDGPIDFNPAEICARPYEQRLVVAKVTYVPTRKDKSTGREYDERNEVKTFYAASTWKNPFGAPNAASGSTSMLP